MAAFPGNQPVIPEGYSYFQGLPPGLKRSRGDLAGFVPSPSDPLYLVSPFLIDGSPVGQVQPSQSGEDASSSRLEARAIMNDFVLLSNTGNCMFESNSRGIFQKVWVMSNNQRCAYFENLAQVVRGGQQDHEMLSLLQMFTNGSSNFANLGQLLMDAYTYISKHTGGMAALQSPGIGFPNRSPWTTYTTFGMGSQKQNSVPLDDRRWVTPNFFTPSLSVEQSFDMNAMEVGRVEGVDESNKIMLDKMNARKKTVSALNRMKQFVVPSSQTSETGSASSGYAGSTTVGSISSDSPQVSPSMPGLSTLPNMPFNFGSSFPMHSMYSHPGAMSMSHSPNSMMITPPERMLVNPGMRCTISPDYGAQETVVCRRKKPRIADSSGPKGVSKTGSTWRIQVQVRGGVLVDSFGNTTERKKYRFSRYVSDYVEALWMYEVAILLSNRPKDLTTQIENGNYRVLVDQKILSSPDEYYLELGVKVSNFAHSERGRDDNSERLLAIQAYDLMKPSNGLSLAELGQSIINLGPMYSSITRSVK